MYRNTTDGSLDNEAVKIANAFKPFWKKWTKEWGRNCVRSKKMTVTTAPSIISGLIGVTDAFSNVECMIPFQSNVANARVGDTVWVRWSGDNQQTMYAENMGNLATASYVPTSGGDGFLYRQSNVVSQKELMKPLWTGTWNTGSITVDGISQYRMCIVRMSSQGALMLAFIYDNGSTVFFRGEGGYAVSASAETRYYISATLSGDTLTMDDCHSINASGTRTERTVSEIIGII